MLLLLLLLTAAAPLAPAPPAAAKWTPLSQTFAELEPTSSAKPRTRKGGGTGLGDQTRRPTTRHVARPRSCKATGGTPTSPPTAVAECCHAFPS
ncbi:unnamed protein product [Sphagnum jensenii]|uniref:Secreted protein n=1 Tax=Sphagnum jensenii TaxID=128206 RepID=A0ABP0WWI2_9BRYO